MFPHTGRALPDVWGGVECTVNRLGDRYFDQLELTGHARRLSDLDHIAPLGIRTLRYPVLWERVMRAPGEYDWSWSDERLGRLRELGIDPIVGLVHHGSGPRWTSLIDEGFATGLADFAARVAERYPWVDRYTVVNEPLTTARFSGLYGLWYPHAKDDRTMVRALLTQCRAIVLAMKAIRAIAPQAELVQTEDVSTTTSGPRAAGQAAFYRERAWLTFDLLLGRVTPRHPLYGYLRGAGATGADLDFFRTHRTPPDVLGLNYYVTSDRYLDDEVHRYDPGMRHVSPLGTFVDLEAARAACGIAGHRRHLEAAWQRYHRPLAITEVHLECTGEDQMRWWREAWDAACHARAAGIPVKAVTAWALFGSVDWSSLLTAFRGVHERGPFAVHDGKVRRRALAGAIAQSAAGRPIDHPAAYGPGWWRRGRNMPTAPGPRPLLISGPGTLGRAIARACELRGLPYQLVSRHDMDIASPGAVHDTLEQVRPWAVINASGYVRVDEAERARDACWRENVTGPSVLAEAAGARGLPFVTYSSDLVFDGAQTRPYIEGDQVRPLSVYGLSKAEAERAVLERWSRSLVIRTAAFFGPEDQANFVTQALRRVLSGQEWLAPADIFVSPTYVPDLAGATLELLLDGADGIWHVTNAGAISWWDLACAAAIRVGARLDLVRPACGEPSPSLAPRPRYSALGSAKGALMPTLEAALDRYVAEVDRAAFETPALDARS